MRLPGHLSRQGPEIFRWVAYEAGKTHGRAPVPGHDYYAAVKDRTDGKIAALSQARKLIPRSATSWPNSATARSPSPGPGPRQPVTSSVTPPGDKPQPPSSDGAQPRPAPAAAVRLLPAAQGTQPRRRQMQSPWQTPGRRRRWVSICYLMPAPRAGTGSFPLTSCTC